MLDAIRLWCVGCDASASADGRAQTAMRLMLIERIDGILSGERFLQPNEADILRETRENLRSMFLPRRSMCVQTIFLRCMQCMDAIEHGERSARELSELIRKWKEMT